MGIIQANPQNNPAIIGPLGQVRSLRFQEGTLSLGPRLQTGGLGRCPLKPQAAGSQLLLINDWPAGPLPSPEPQP